MMLSELAARVELDVDEYRNLLNVFIKATRADLAALRAALADGAMEAAARAAHSIKGAALNLELAEMGETAARAEAESMAGQVDGMEEHVVQLNSTLDALDALARS